MIQALFEGFVDNSEIVRSACLYFSFANRKERCYYDPGYLVSWKPFCLTIFCIVVNSIFAASRGGVLVHTSLYQINLHFHSGFGFVVLAFLVTRVLHLSQFHIPSYGPIQNFQKTGTDNDTLKHCQTLGPRIL